MNITRNNYEEFFMLYADNELPDAERKEVEAFIAANPDLQQELILFQQFKLRPDTAVVFTGKEALMKQETGLESITTGNYEAFFVLYADDELTNNEKAKVEDFVYHHPELQSSFELLQQVKLRPETHIVFEDKESLYRKEEDDKVVPFRWWKLAAAAMILLMAGIFWLYQVKKNNQHQEIVKKTQPASVPSQSSSQKLPGTATTDTGNNEKTNGETVAAADNPRATVQLANAVTAAVKKEIKQEHNKRPGLQDSPVEADLASNSDNGLKGITITSMNKTEKKAEINTGMTAAANKSIPDQQLAYLNTDEPNKAEAGQALATNTDKLEVLNTSVNTKNSLRGFFRKASRLIAKKTSVGDEDSNRKTILIGGFEIAVR
jgi:cytoskeletal protein RodZ